jgi:hypothetical protein
MLAEKLRIEAPIYFLGTAQIVGTGLLESKT